MIAPRSRASDERILEMVRLRASGLTACAVATRLGIEPGYVRAVTNRVSQADVAESGEDVIAAYWPEVAARIAA